VRSGPGAARTILLFHIISARPSKQPRMVRTFLKVYMELGSYFLFLQEQIKDIIIKDIIIITCQSIAVAHGVALPKCLNPEVRVKHTLTHTDTHILCAVEAELDSTCAPRPCGNHPCPPCLCYSHRGSAMPSMLHRRTH
jgi:hypothetical protein